ncbi:MAG: hypothetical protein A3G49_01405 [Candidatus Sungbacteria bacterium RIFCSPLOWO2_12_FULL_41_11]|uniref:Uncharacterized protein n=1 Tax=Candidatus Sungbacteria bacterium RIFCSPLOWO2_12_FULL_41_11 TaxID=1802286 RepID=A0A1G2LQH1_9BACT|nr:MAG: hypothetical protein A3G49_01405 [Candidatus Sungbacteria bacterium RIFCSPLOWO2_12_FULL_41_11]
MRSRRPKKSLGVSGRRAPKESTAHFLRGKQNEKSKEYFSVVWRALASGGGLASLVWFRSEISDKMSSSQTVKTHKPKFWCGVLLLLFIVLFFALRYHNR